MVSSDLEEIVKSAINEVEQAKMSTANLNQIEADILVVDNGTREILAASMEIATTIGQAKRGIEQIASASQQAEKAATEAASAAAQQSKGAEELASAIEEISSLADELQSAA
jgi:methyl-accepting chemotaxis protein